jgi:hypothetical protein
LWLGIRILSDDTHLSCGFLTNADWFAFVFEFSPPTFPVNHGDKAVEIGRNRFRFAIFYPHTELRPMFSFTFAGGWLAHLLGLAVAMRALPAGFSQPGFDLLQSWTGYSGLV